MRVIVCGSRGWTDHAQITARLAELPRGTTIVVGYNPEKNSPRGADRFAYHDAQNLGLTVETHPAEWDRYGKAAGYLRNAEMADTGADLCIAFWDEQSDGTRHMMTLAEKRGIPVETIRQGQASSNTDLQPYSSTT